MADYEFSESENTLIRDLARKMRFVGIFLTIAGVLYLLASGGAFLQALRGRDSSDSVQGVFSLLGAVLYLALGVWTHKSGRSFQQIVESQGEDIRHLMDALANLRRIYSLYYIVILVVLLLLVLTLVASLLWVWPWLPQPAA
ncbi:MAG: hypothetical protein KatS3mg109_2023 [Pirellulaceae bacterium]|nr:MAG: hypothetical protein KatS3mg109_1934 [Pirellulaceae bacterium]GIW91591.1 MAG: hypothetical protein KatS3mg109_2023 [Pirellulaceae bacterium]